MLRVLLISLIFICSVTAEKAKVVACVGDSNTQRAYPAILQKQLGSDWKTINCGIGAATVVDGTFRPYHKMKQYQQALSTKADFIIIMLGTNDANPRWWTKDRKSDFKGTFQEEFKKRYLDLIASFKKLESKPRLILAVPLPIFPKKAKEANRDNTAGRNKNFNEIIVPIIREIAEKEKLPLVDIQKQLSKDEKLCTDGVHFNKEGYAKMSSAFAEKLKELAK